MTAVWPWRSLVAQELQEERLAERCGRWYCDPEGFAQKQRP
jgi:hypothetical protein